MAIARTLTKKAPTESKSRPRKSSVSKLQISAPVELVSTTNMLSYTSPNLRSFHQSQSPSGVISSPSPTRSTSIKSPLGLSRSSTTSSSSSSSFSSTSSPNSDRINSAAFFLPPMADDHPSAFVTSPKSPHRHGFVFSSSGSPLISPSSQPIPPIPPIPQMSSSRSSTSSLNRTRSTASIRRSGQQHSSSSSTNPFAAELHKVSEIAESFGILGGFDLGGIREEEEYMRRRGLRRFEVEEYMEALGLVSGEDGVGADGGMGGWI